jgi:ribonuclease-3
MTDISKLTKKLGIRIKNKDLILQAFCHRSYLNENPSFHLDNNERLEFLGDAVLELVVTDHLYKDHPEKPEGELTNWRASLVNAKILGELARDLGFNDFLLLSRGESKETGKARQYILANAFEAFIGALFLDLGYKACNDFINKYLLVKLEDIVEKGLFKDVKSKFQEESQERMGVTPNYKVLKESGPDHAKNFTVGIFLNDDLIAEGNGSSKQEAEEEAAKNALTAKEW